jgi:hypothetical protein
LTETKFFTKGFLMRFACKFFAVVSLSILGGVMVGSVPALLMDARAASRAASAKQDRDDPFPPGEKYHFHAGFENVEADGVPGGVQVSGEFVIGVPSTMKETHSIHLSITDEDGTEWARDLLDLTTAKAHERDIETPFSVSYDLPSGQYQVSLYAIREGVTRHEQDGSIGPHVPCESNRLVTVP